MVTKKKKEELLPPPDLRVIGRLGEAQYWKWRLTIEEKEHAETRAKVSNLLASLKIMEMKKCESELNLCRRDIQLSQKLILGMEAEYTSVKEEIEKDLGISLENCTISPQSFEVKKLPPKEESKDGTG